MKTWLGPLRIVLVTAMMAQLTGCASTARTFARWTGRGGDDQQLAELDGKAAKESASKSRGEPKRPDTSTAKSKVNADVDDDRIIAEKINPKAKPTTAPKAKAPDETAVAQAKPKAPAVKETGVAKTAPKLPADQELAVKPASAKKPFVDPFEGLDASGDVPFEPIAKSEQNDKPAVKPSAAASIDQAVAKAASTTRQAIQEVNHLRETSELPEWAAEEGVTRTQPTRKPAAAEAPVIEKPLPKLEGADLQPGQPAPNARRANPLLDTVKQVATAKLAQLCPEATGEVKQLIGTLETTDVEALKRSIHRLGRMQTDAAASAPALKQLLRHQDGFVRTHAALALVRMKEVTPEVTETLIVGLRSTNPGVRSFAAAVLAEMGPDSADALPALSSALHDRDGYVRLHVAEVLIRHDDWSQQALNTLVDCLKDKDENVRWLASYSLAELAPQSFDAVTALQAALHDPTPKVRVGAAYALGEIGPLAKAAVPELSRLSESSDSETKTAATFALKQINEN